MTSEKSRSGSHQKDGWWVRLHPTCNAMTEYTYKARTSLAHHLCNNRTKLVKTRSLTASLPDFCPCTT